MDAFQVVEKSDPGVVQTRPRECPGPTSSNALYKRIHAQEVMELFSHLAKLGITEQPL